MINERIFLRAPIEFQNICKIYPPTVNDVVLNENYNTYQYSLTLTQEDLDDEYDKTPQPFGFVTPTPFQYIMANCEANEDFMNIITDALEFFLHEPLTIIPELKIIFIGKYDEDINPDEDFENPRLIKEDNYFDFQNRLREAIGVKAIELPDPDEDPRVRRIKAKARYRDKIKAKKGGGLDLGTSLAALCCMGIGLNPLNIGEISYASVSWLIQLYQQKESYETDVKAIMAGADANKINPKYWIRKLN